MVACSAEDDGGGVGWVCVRPRSEEWGSWNGIYVPPIAPKPNADPNGATKKIAIEKCGFTHTARRQCGSEHTPRGIVILLLLLRTLLPMVCFASLARTCRSPEVCVLWGAA